MTGDEPQLSGQQRDDNSPGLPSEWKKKREQDTRGMVYRTLSLSFADWSNLYLGGVGGVRRISDWEPPAGRTLLSSQIPRILGVDWATDEDTNA